MRLFAFQFRGALASAGLWVFAGGLGLADLVVLEETETDSAALNFSTASASFNQNINGRTYQRLPLTTYGGYQYATYFNGDRRVCLGRRKLPDGAWEVIEFNDYSIPGHDAHNVATVGICPKDGTIHLAFDHHTDPLNYRVSQQDFATNPKSVTWSTALFGSITDQLEGEGQLSSVTYPSILQCTEWEPHVSLSLLGFGEWRWNDS
jgi:hypothetical protein